MDGPCKTLLANFVIFMKNRIKTIRELKTLHQLLKEIYEFNHEKEKLHQATDTRWIYHKPEKLQNLLDMGYTCNILISLQRKCKS